jgi:acetyl-CoA C-acetyltransferase
MFINGVGRTKFGKLSKTISELTYEAMLNAVEDSPLEITDIDAIFVSNFLGGPLNGQLHFNSVVASLLPSLNIPIIRVETACASSSVALNQALNCLNSTSNVMVVGVEKMTGTKLISPTDAIAMAGDHENDYEQGLIFPAAYALIAQQYLHRYGVSHEILEKVSYLNHKNANLNSLAHFYHKQVTMEMIRSSMVIATPLNLFDCSPLSDGAASVIISSDRHSDRDIEIASSQIATDTISLTQRESLTSFKATRIAAGKAYAEAGLTPKDLDVVEVHDCFTISELLALEDLGLCEPGQASELVESGALGITGEIPVNPDGGLKANGHPIGATGLAQIFELVTQLRMEAGPRQVADAETGLAQNIGGIGGTCGITILRA